MRSITDCLNKQVAVLSYEKTIDEGVNIMPADFFKLALEKPNEFTFINRSYIVQVTTTSDNTLYGATIFLEKDNSANTIVHVKNEDTKELLEWLLAN